MIEIEIEDGVIWVYGGGEDGIQVFTDFGIENVIELIKSRGNPASSLATIVTLDQLLLQ